MTIKQKDKVLVIDDDIRIVRMIKRMLELEGFEAITAGNGETGMELIDSEDPDLVLLDIMMADIDGYTVCRRIREFSDVPIIMVSAKSDEQDKVKSLNIGADDYVTKPFSASELAARVKAHLRRNGNLETTGEAVFRCNGFEINFASHRVTIDNRELLLSATEYKLLSYFAKNAGRLLTHDQLLNNVWGEEYIGDTHILQVNISRIRSKLGDDSRHPRIIQSRNGIGYMIAKQDIN